MPTYFTRVLASVSWRFCRYGERITRVRYIYAMLIFDIIFPPSDCSGGVCFVIITPNITSSLFFCLKIGNFPYNCDYYNSFRLNPQTFKLIVKYSVEKVENVLYYRGFSTLFKLPVEYSPKITALPAEVCSTTAAVLRNGGR